MRKRSPTSPSLRLRIEPIVARAEQDAAAVQRELPGHEGLLNVAKGVAEAAHEAERVSRELRRLLSFHRLPALFLALAMLLFAAWCYWYFFHVSELSIALPDRDAIELRERVAKRPRVVFHPVTVPGSREAAAMVAAGKVDLAFVQGGIPFPAELPRLESPRGELVLFFLRDGIAGPAEVKRILTSVVDEGSHSVAQQFVSAWGIGDQVSYVHEWTELTNDANYVIPSDVSAVFVVKDPGSEKTLYAAERLATAGFRLASPDLGARALRLEYLRPTEMPSGYLRSAPPFPPTPIATYHVSTYLVARAGLTPRVLGLAADLLDQRPELISAAGFEPDLATTSDMLQGMEAFIGILAYIGLAFLALLGIEVMTYRRRFSELDSLISVISMHQANKDVLGIRDPATRSANLQYLSTCSDLLGLISVIAGYYSQENASLLYNNLLSIIHDRSSSLKLNIQLKILHASLDVEALATPAASDAHSTDGKPKPSTAAPAAVASNPDNPELAQ